MSIKSNRRAFLRLSGLAGLVLAGGSGIARAHKGEQLTDHSAPGQQGQRFNMCGYAAARLDTVRVGFIGLGNRGPGAVQRMNRIEGVAINALCDIRTEKANASARLLDNTNHRPEIYSGSAEAWKKVCERDDIDLVYIATPWSLHVPMAVYAMEQGKHVAVEVPAAVTVDECWQLVETSERTKRHCVILENCCYDFFELLTLNMGRQGMFGEVLHAEGAYIHTLMDLNFSKTGYYDMWRLKENTRNGNLYPTHGLGPVAQLLDINRGDRMDYLVSVSTSDFTMGPQARELGATDEFYKPFANKSFRGNMNTTTIRTIKGKTIMLQHDVSSPRPYSRIHLLSGTKGMAVKYPQPRIAFGHEGWISEEDFSAMEEKFTAPIVKRVGELAKQIGGHGGMDFLMDWRLIDCLRNGLPVDMDVYDAAAWSVVSPLSEKSVASRSASVDVPDFTRGAWKTNQRVDISMAKGGTTAVKP